MKVVLLEKMPLMYKGNHAFYDEGTEFELVEEKTLAIVGKCYKVQGFGVVFDGWQVAKFWKKVTK